MKKANSAKTPPSHEALFVTTCLPVGSKKLMENFMLEVARRLERTKLIASFQVDQFGRPVDIVWTEDGNTLLTLLSKLYADYHCMPMYDDVVAYTMRLSGRPV